MEKFLPSCLVFLTLGLAGSGLRAGTDAVAFQAGLPDFPPVLVEAMEAAVGQDFPTALQLLRNLETDCPAVGREVDFCLAILLLSAPPITPARINEATRLLTAVRSRSGNDDLGVAALFFLARIEQVHRTPPATALAQSLFEELVRDHPDHWFGELAILKLSTLDLNRPDQPMPGWERVLYWLERGRRLQDPVMRRNFLWTMGDAVLRHGGDPRLALALYGEGDQIGYSRFDIRGLMMLRIHNLALTLGKEELAREAGERWLASFPRSNLNQLIRDQLEAGPGGKEYP